MEHADHVELIRGGIPDAGSTWADLGSGGGAFTLALADLLGPEGIVYSVDRNRRALRDQQRAMSARFPRTQVHYLTADFTRPLSLPQLDGIVMANSLHFVRGRDKPAVLQQVKGYLQPGGSLIVVEYNADRGNHWVPHPFSFPTWQQIASQTGFTDTQLLATRPSRFLGEIYAALSRNPS